jgi:hypothetical protein
MQTIGTYDAYQGMIADLKTRILERVLVIVAVGVSASVLLNNLTFGTPSTTLMTLWLLVVASCIGCYVLKGYSLRLAAYAALGMSLVIILLSAIVLNSVALLYLLPILVLVARFIAGTSEAMLISIISSVFIISPTFNSLENSSTTFITLIILWATVAFTEIIVEGVMGVLKTVNQYQHYPCDNSLSLPYRVQFTWRFRTNY